MDLRSPRGWYQDPYAIHEYRYFSAGRPTKLVRDDGHDSYDPPPSGTIPEGDLVPAVARTEEALSAEAEQSPLSTRMQRAVFDYFDRLIKPWVTRRPLAASCRRRSGWPLHAPLQRAARDALPSARNGATQGNTCARPGESTAMTHGRNVACIWPAALLHNARHEPVARLARNRLKLLKRPPLISDGAPMLGAIGISPGDARD
jgi:hypothetical protein